ncbi:dihydrofolate reductase [Rhizobium sp. NFR07]|uniref:dihydrofolate reductase n=1 Tax=Rhizobium sp. NFR07 TaxID=1566262 RepID=UPI0008E56348|nr:dihydrofolate reductase [Rhizobium sp. NFR07]SFB48872.1 dihydrofolate reductase [Rhizobium sp. NFR07]
MSVPVSIVVAMSENGVIGRDGDMPWRLSTDLKRFKALTLGKPVVVGRKTLESFGGKPLPGRPHVIVTRNPDFVVEGAVTVTSIEEGLAVAQKIAAETGAGEVAVIGGGEIYKQAMHAADILYVTHVETVIDDGDTMFPDIDSALFDKCEETQVPAGERDSYPTRFAIYRRKSAAN